MGDLRLLFGWSSTPVARKLVLHLNTSINSLNTIFFFSDDKGQRIVDEDAWNDDVDTNPLDSQGNDTLSTGTGKETEASESNTSPGERLKEMNVTPEPNPNEQLPVETNAGNDISKETKGNMVQERANKSMFVFEKIKISRICCCI